MGMISRQIGELDDIKWASVPKALAAIEKHRDVVLGVKVRLTRESIVGAGAGLKPLLPCPGGGGRGRAADHGPSAELVGGIASTRWWR